MDDMTHRREIASAGLPIYIIGAGGIVQDAHLPAYRLAGFTVAGICDLDESKARHRAAQFGIEKVFSSVESMLADMPANAVIDMALPTPAVLPMLQKMPPSAAVLIQKPMGENMAEAKAILDIVHEKNLLAAVNFQLRYAPFILEVKRMIAEDLLGTIHDVEVNVNVFTPWHLWDFLVAAPRVEILYHSIHYIDLVRHMLGNPQSVYAKTTKHPAMANMASVRSNIIMDYGDMIRANIITNHCHNYGVPKQHSYIKFEGSRGAVIINFGTLINYPRGEADSFEYCLLEDRKAPEWRSKKIDGSWFPHAFIGSMEQLMLARAGKVSQPDNGVQDCLYTMACVEAAYQSSASGGTSINQFLPKKQFSLS